MVLGNYAWTYKSLYCSPSHLSSEILILWNQSWHLLQPFAGTIDAVLPVKSCQSHALLPTEAANLIEEFLGGDLWPVLLHSFRLDELYEVALPDLNKDYAYESSEMGAHFSVQFDTEWGLSCQEGLKFQIIQEFL